MYDTLKEVIDNYEPTADFQKELCEDWYNKVNQVPQLKALRDFVEENQFGHGERPFYWMWYVLAQEMPIKFSFCEVGVYKSQTLVMMDLIAQMQSKTVLRVGISPLTSEGGHPESDYEADIKTLHDFSEVPMDLHLIKGRSQDPVVMIEAKMASGRGYDMIYIDGNHSTEVVTADILNYLPMLKVGGFLIMDDCCNGWDLPQGYFSGISSVSDAVNSLLPPTTESEDVEFLFNCCHVRVYRKLK